MNKLYRYLQTYLILAIPFVAACMIWSNYRQDGSDQIQLIHGFLWELLSWNLMFWFVCLLVFVVLLVTVPRARNQTLRRIANLKDRDEREQIVTGRAARASYISTLSMLILFLFLSIVQVEVEKLSPQHALNGKTGIMKIGLKFNMLDSPRVEHSPDGKVLFESKDIPLSKTGIVLFIFVWQLASFGLSARRELAVE
jgi:hypothetical protein